MAPRHVHLTRPAASVNAIVYLYYLSVLLLDDDHEAPLPPEADIAGHLARMLDVVSNNEAVHDGLNIVLVSPNYKEGDRADPANYLYGECLFRMYAAVLNAWLVPWLKTHE